MNEAQRITDDMPHPGPDDGVLLPGERNEPTRRAFLRYTGFGISAALFAGCSRAPLQRAIPKLVAEEGRDAGAAYWVATTCAACTAGCGILARCRDGRPIKLEGNPDHPLSRGGLCAAGQAAVLGLYDGRRSGVPRLDGRELTWHAADRRMREELERVRREGGRVRILTRTVTSPSTRALIERLCASLPDARHVEYDPLSSSALLEAHERTRGARVLPRLRLERADLVVSFDEDFLGTGRAPVEHAAAQALARDLGADPPRLARHVQLEARLSLSGCRADERIVLAPGERGAALAGLVEALAARRGKPSAIRGALEGSPLRADLERLADELLAHAGRCVVLVGSNDLGEQMLGCAANEWIDAYGATLDLTRPSLQRRGDDRALEGLVAELETGRVDLLVVAGANPAYDTPLAAAGGAALGTARFTVALTDHPDETSRHADLHLPRAHFLESWDDAESALGILSLTQPTVPLLRGGRTLREVLARWMGDGREDRELLREHWKLAIHPRSENAGPFDTFFERALHDGVIELPVGTAARGTFRWDVLEAPAAQPSPPDLSLVLYPKVGLLDGSGAHNPWLQELPDPVTKITWDNYVCLAPGRARALALGEGDVVRLEVEAGSAVELPVHIQIGQHEAVACVALGYGRLGTDRFAGIGPDWIGARPTVTVGDTVGRNAAPLLAFRDGALAYDGAPVRVQPLGRRVDLAATQDHHSQNLPEHLAPKGAAARRVAQRTTWAAWMADPARAVERFEGPVHDLWPDDHANDGPRWGLVIDLTRCTGCSACMVACQIENNVPVVGRDEVRRHREMHWLRVDRYLDEGEGALRVEHQPMLCQHCGSAPCESVCPVLATVHSADGLNQQVYNRCVGTRYCANACPYKVRRFNWFDYPREDELRDHGLNPDVTVRSRGVMEKCSMCAQRIQAARAAALREGRVLRDGEIQTACQQSCPTRAITFGDRSDPESAVARQGAGTLAYTVLEELNVRPAVGYLARVRREGLPPRATEADHEG